MKDDATTLAFVTFGHIAFSHVAIIWISVIGTEQERLLSEA